MGNAVKVFLEGVLASLVAGILLIALGSFLSKKARWVLTATLGRLLDIDIEYVFRTQEELSEDLRKELNRASFIYLLTGRGSDLQRETFASVLSHRQKGRLSQFKILLPEPRPKAGETDWTAQRENELAAVDPAFGKGVLRDQIETTVKFLSSYVDSKDVELKFFNYPHVGRILITDRAAYFSPYRQDAHGRDSSIIKYRHGGEMYDFLLRLFNQLWS
jgi:hypothetical protein